jgi:hypothetical protein
LKTAIEKHIAFDASEQEIGNYLQEILDRIERGKETPQLSSAMHFFYGRLLLHSGEFEKATKEFRASSIFCVDYGLEEHFEIIFWMGKIAEMKNDFERAKSTYQMALKQCKDNPLFITRDQILDAINNLPK